MEAISRRPGAAGPFTTGTRSAAGPQHALPQCRLLHRTRRLHIVLQHSEADGAAGRARGRASRFGQWPGRSSLRSSFCIGTGIGAGALAASGGGSGSNGWVGGGSGGGGDGSFGSGGGTAAAANVLGEIAVSDAADALVEEVILLDVGGMKCGGCVSHVKTILEQQPGVVSASVNLATETALVRIKLPAGSGEKELAQAADKLAQVLTSGSFPARVKQPTRLAA